MVSYATELQGALPGLRTLVNDSKLFSRIDVRGLDSNEERVKMLVGVEAVAKIVQCIFEGQSLKGFDTVVEEASAHALSRVITRVTSDRNEVRRVVTKMASGMGETHGPRWIKAERLLRSALTATGIDASEALRDVRGRLQEVALADAGLRPEIPWLAYAAVCWRLGFGAADVGQSLRMAWEKRSGVVDAITHVLAAMYSEFLRTSGDKKEAGAVLDAIASTPGVAPEVRLLVAHHHLRAQRPDQAIDQVERACAQDPIFGHFALSDPHLMSITRSILSVLMATQAAIRTDSLNLITTWGVALDKVRGVEEECQVEIDLPTSLREYRTTLQHALPDADWLTAVYISARSESAIRDVIKRAQRGTVDYRERCESEISTARSQLELARKKRDAYVRAAESERNRTLEAYRESMTPDYEGIDHLQSKALKSFSMGCGGFIAYLAFAAYLTYKGIQAGLTSPLGLAVIGVASVPVLFAVSWQIKSGRMRAHLDVTVGKVAMEANRVLRARIAHAEALCNEEIRALEAVVAEAELRYERAENALKLLDKLAG